jgi:hypothetical protein
MVALEMFVEVLGGEALVALAVQPLDLEGRLIGHRPAGAPSKPPVAQARLALGLETLNIAPECPFAHAQNLGRLKLAQGAFLPMRQDISQLQHPQSL